MLKKILFVFLIFFPFLSLADEMVTISDISQDGSLILSDGKRIKLADIFIDDEFLQESVGLIEGWQGHEVEIFYINDKANRNGEYLAHIKNKDNKLIVNQLVEAGFAFYYLTSEKSHYTKELKESEALAKKNKAGIWQDREIFSSDGIKSQLKKNINKFQFVEGNVFEVKKVRDKLYINFENDWKTDLTVLIRKENWKNFPNLKLEELAGKRVRVRGWLESYNGPMIEIYNEGHLELI